LIEISATDDQNANRSGASNLHQFYITTKVGPVNVKVGDFYSTIGLGAWSKSEKSTDALSLYTPYVVKKISAKLQRWY
jgi:hypothetical protein